MLKTWCLLLCRLWWLQCNLWMVCSDMKRRWRMQEKTLSVLQWWHENVNIHSVHCATLHSGNRKHRVMQVIMNLLIIIWYIPYCTTAWSDKHWLPLIEGSGLSSTDASDIVSGVRTSFFLSKIKLRLNRRILSVQPQEFRGSWCALWKWQKCTQTVSVDEHLNPFESTQCCNLLRDRW